MASGNEISTLQKIMVKPMTWKLIENIDGSYSLAFTYVSPEREEWANVQSKRGPAKAYKTADAALRDIARVQTEAHIMAFLREPQ